MPTLWSLRNSWALAFAFLALELVLSALIVLRVPYTEIDWRAYMQEVEGAMGGELNYYNLKGDTGPLVYPAGFVYLYSALWWLTDSGKNIFSGQLIFVGLYMATQTVVFAIAHKSRIVPPWALILFCISKRMHSIFMLRLFNDCFAMFFLYLAILSLCHNKWSIASLLFSIGVSIKMNVILFSVPLLWLYLAHGGTIFAIKNIAICAAVQVALGLPFLATHPVAYLHKSFELSRVFFYEWTVNWRCVSEETFLSRPFAITLLALHLLSLALLFYKHCPSLRSSKRCAVTPRYIVLLMCAGNLCGVVFSRTLHYQFYSWYFHTLPFLLWSGGPLPSPLRLLVIVGIEVAFNVFPSLPWSSALLHFCHLILLLNIFLAPPWDSQGQKRK